MEAERAAVKHAVERLGHGPIMAEDFGARPSSPQVACLGGVRESDLVILVLGPRYGVPQAGGVSATHEEILEARNRKPILVFLQAGAQPEDSQVALINEVGGWEGGLFRQEFASPEDLEDKVTRAVHRHELAHAVAPLNPEELKARATRLLPALERGYGANTLQLAIASGPVSAILRPAEMEAPSWLTAQYRADAVRAACLLAPLAAVGAAVAAPPPLCSKEAPIDILIAAPTPGRFRAVCRLKVGQTPSHAYRI